MIRRILILALAAVASLAATSDASAAPAQHACSRILVLDEYGRDITPCGRPDVMTADQIIALVRARISAPR